MLKYTGNGFFIGIPSRDLSDEEVKKYGSKEYLERLGIELKDYKDEETALCRLGLWEKSLKAKKENKMLQPEEAANKEE